jgi:hypothetical protein
MINIIIPFACKSNKQIGNPVTLGIPQQHKEYVIDATITMYIYSFSSIQDKRTWCKIFPSNLQGIIQLRDDGYDYGSESDSPIVGLSLFRQDDGFKLLYGVDDYPYQMQVDFTRRHYRCRLRKHWLEWQPVPKV